MKKFILIIISTFLFLGLFGCSRQQKSNNASIKQQSNVTVQDVREVVWNQLNTIDKKRIKGTWKDSKVRKITLKGNMGKLNDSSYIDKEVYIIDFQTNSNFIPNNMVVYASLDNYKLIGYGYVE